MVRNGYDNFRVTGFVPAGEQGRVRVEVTEPVSQVHAGLAFLQQRARLTPGEQYTQLLLGHRLVTSDTPDEYRDHWEAISEARGRVLIHGLGLGCYLKAILAKPEVKHVDVVELDEDVLGFIGPLYDDDPRVELHHDDALTRKWPVGTTWDCVWHDIWPDKNTDDLEQHAKLLRSYGGRCGWQGAWAHDQLQAWRRGGW